MQKRIIHKEELNEIKLEGVRALAEIVGNTLGPGGLPIMIQRTGQALDGTTLKPRITKDGVSVANECFLPDPAQDLIVQTVKAICQKTNEEAGDGTTTAIILGHAILGESLELMKVEHTLPPQQVKRELEEALDIIIEDLNVQSTPISNYEEIKQVASLSANGDEEVGSILAKAFEGVGAEGVITVDEGSTPGLSLETVNGYRFDRGAEGRDVFYNNQHLTQFEGKNAIIVVYDGAVRSQSELVPLISLVADVDPKTGFSRQIPPPVVIIANEFSRDVIQWCLILKADQGLQVCLVRGPNMSNIRTNYYDDIATYCGGYRFGNGNLGLAEVTPPRLGSVERVVVGRYHTTMYGGNGKEVDVLSRVTQLKAAKELAESPFDVQTFNDRIAAITNGIAKIYVGGHSEVEIKERYDRVEDALNASRAAIQGGVVPGGGAALLKAAFRLGEDTAGKRIMKKAISTPFQTILWNCGYNLNQIEKFAEGVLKNDTNIVDAISGKLESAFNVGILDPLKVTMSALKNAVSVSALLLTAGGAIIIEGGDKADD